MGNKSIIIIGAGMGGLAAGIYGQMNGYQTQIFEMHSVPGGQVAAWKRKGYTFDACIHHLFGCNDFSRIYGLWHEMGAMPRELVYTDDCVSVVSPDGRLFKDYYDLEKLERHLKELSPADAHVIDDYIKGIKSQAKQDYFGDFAFGGIGDLIKIIPGMLANLGWFKPDMEDFADRFSDPFLIKAFPLLEYSLPHAPFFLHLIKHAYGYRKSIAWPVGGAPGFASSIEKRYRGLGGKVHYHQKVVKIITENDRAVGIKLADGSEHRADIIIFNADGRKTIMNMLEGRYINERIKGYCSPPPDETNWAVLVFLGVARDLSLEPSGLVMLLDKPVIIANHENHSLEMQLYGFDKTMAPEGKGVIKVELVSQYSCWKNLYEDKSRYDSEKQKIAGQVIEQLSHYFKGIESQIEVVDVATLMTWEKFMGGTNGFNNFPVKKASFTASLFSRNLENTLPGLANFYMVGAWTTSLGATFMNAFSGKKAIQAICKADGKKFIASVDFTKLKNREIMNFFNSVYEGIPPWDIGRPQKEIIRLAQAGEISGRVLDAGCGTGENALYLAGMGFEVWGIDATPLAIKKAKEKARDRGITVNFLVSDALKLQSLRTKFDTVIDCGLFHVFTDEERPIFEASLSSALHPGGRYFMLCFSEHEPGSYGPRRVTQAEIRETFSKGWSINYIREAEFETMFGDEGVKAWLSSITRLQTTAIT